jgi:hypothetical protein
MPLKDPLKKKEYDRHYWKRWQANNAKNCKVCGKVIRPHSTYCYAHAKTGRVRKQAYQKRMRTAALNLLARGKPIVCESCGCDVFEFLQINHVNGGGSAEYRARRGRRITTEIVRGRRAIDDLNILCALCNWAYFFQLKYGTSSYTITWNKD